MFKVGFSGLVAGLSMLTACTPAQVSAFDAAINAGDKALVSAAPLICDVLDLTDPANAQAICQVIDEAGTAIATLPVIVEPIAAITALVAAHHAKSAAAQTSLSVAKTKLRWAKGAK